MNTQDTVRYREFAANLQKLVNGAQLPPFVLIPVFREALAQLVKQDEQQYQAEKQRMETAKDSEPKEAVADADQ